MKQPGSHQEAGKLLTSSDGSEGVASAGNQRQGGSKSSSAEQGDLV